ncbi:DUF305 domain-containing protein [Xanthomonas perforans]|jgi:uncharacterized protein (DUF305 family)|uniref:DUF305 domain-containing protein n=2 Tax=Lysobacteraceae TaxID=32033 RepID=A0A9X4BQ07_9XANT|nr:MULTISPECIES: DUF305 domain-containing protein [Xanthomonadaceae]MCC8506277.1 DUF305 domain-containing protein [Xanthomonas hortorum pv. gardneri]MDC8636435.1 DUF305 domain-containing protein [Xanthomonas hortorum pv. hederae]PPT18938.1 DUF305 domain-containing protein [Xanthomonas arboricola]PPT57619.1 DUF305 domain-containing protein [Xanthomonas arboricola]SOU01488.1 hypothetical protein LMG19146_02525 [Xanthomonas arboricola pv. fragariae]
MSSSHGKHESTHTQHSEQHASHGSSGQTHQGHYGRLLLMMALSFLAMYALMYAMVDQWANVYHNVNQFYMAGLMAAPMLLIELWLMSSMYPDRRRNLILAGVTVAFMLFCWWGIRTQAAVTDRQFIRSMIPHHAGAILMCEENRLKDPELVKLCQEIITSQKQEIAQMKQLLAERSR